MKKLYYLAYFLLMMPSVLRAAETADAAQKREEGEANPAISIVKTINLSDLHPSQVRIAMQTVEKKKGKIRKGKGGRKIKDGTFSRNSPLPVMQVEGQYYLVDGHHELVAAMSDEDGLRAKSAVVQVVKVDGTVKEMMERDRAAYGGNELKFYLWGVNADGTISWKDPFNTLSELGDAKNNDENRQFFGMTKIKRKDGESDDAPGKKTYAVWVKHYGKVPPFGEYILGDILRAFGFVAEKGDHKVFERAHKAWEILKSVVDGAKNEGYHPFNWKGLDLSWLILADEPEDKSKK